MPEERIEEGVRRIGAVLRELLGQGEADAPLEREAVAG
jgi:hypothetical protein